MECPVGCRRPFWRDRQGRRDMGAGDVRVAFVLMEGIESVECTVVSGTFKKHLDNVLRYVV